MRYYIGPIPWQTTPLRRYGLPPGCVGMLDLASVPTQATGGADRPMCICWSPAAALSSEYTLLGDGDCRELSATNAMRSAFQSLIGYRPQGEKLVDLFADCLIGGSDPTGLSGPLPLVPGIDGWLDLWMPGHSRVWGEKFEWGRPGSRGSNHTAKLKAMLRQQFTVLFNDAKAGKLKDKEHHRRVLDDWCIKYGVSDWQEFVPQELKKDVPGRIPRETTITDDFTRADGDTIGNQLTWTEVVGDFDTVSNQVQILGGDDGAVKMARAESDLSSSDHYSQIQAVSIGTFDAMDCAARCSNSATTCYYAGSYQPSGNMEIAKLVAGTATQLSTTSISYSFPEPWKLECNGSSIKAYQNGVQRVSVTDSSISGNTRCGIAGYNGTGTGNTLLDDFVAADLGGASGTIYTQLERSTRGILRGMYTRFG